MDDYSIWQDFFDTIQSFPGWLQLLVMMIPPALIITLVQQYIAYRLMRAVIELTGGETLLSSMIDAVYSVHEPVPDLPLPPVPLSPLPLPPLPPLPRQADSETSFSEPWQGKPNLEEQGENPHPLPDQGKAPLPDGEDNKTGEYRGIWKDF